MLGRARPFCLPRQSRMNSVAAHPVYTPTRISEERILAVHLAPYPYPGQNRYAESTSRCNPKTHYSQEAPAITARRDIPECHTEMVG